MATGKFLIKHENFYFVGAANKNFVGKGRGFFLVGGK